MSGYADIFKIRAFQILLYFVGFKSDYGFANITWYKIWSIKGLLYYLLWSLCLLDGEAVRLWTKRVNLHYFDSLDRILLKFKALLFYLP